MKRPPSPVASQDPEPPSIPYSHDMKTVEFEVDGKLTRLSVYDPIEILSKVGIESRALLLIVKSCCWYILVLCVFMISIMVTNILRGIIVLNFFFLQICYLFVFIVLYDLTNFRKSCVVSTIFHFVIRRITKLQCLQL